MNDASESMNDFCIDRTARTLAKGEKKLSSDIN